MNRKQRRAAEKAAGPGKGPSPALQPQLLEAYRLQAAGRLAEAEQQCRAMLSAQSRHGEALNLLGVIALQTGRLELAAETLALAVAVDPSDASRHFNLGSALHKQGRLDEAVERYRQAIARAPDKPAYYNNLGAALSERGRPDAAIPAFRQAIGLKPDFAEAHYNLANALRAADRLDEAVAAYHQALALKPDHAGALHNLGLALGDQRRFEESLPFLRRALELDPNWAEARNSLGAVLNEVGEAEAAEQAYATALTLKPDFPEAHNNLGTLLNRLGRLDAAVASFRTALAGKPGFAEARVNMGQVLMAQGDLAQGWRDYEARWETAEFLKTRQAMTEPLWRGEPAAGRTLVVHAEQGLGDILQFCRYAAPAAARGLKVVLRVPKLLARLLATAPGVDQVISDGDPLPADALHIPMMSLPAALDLPLYAPAEPYLSADPAEAQAWAAKVAKEAAGRLRVGVVWAGNPDLKADARRSISPERLSPLFDIPGVAFFSLQKDRAAPEGSPLIDLMAGVGDFADTAALISNLDLVISVDTAVAHLAAAIGKPVWLLNRFDGCWRWFVERTDSPWYPTLTLYRQPTAGDWDSVVAAMARELGNLTALKPHI